MVRPTRYATPLDRETARVAVILPLRNEADHLEKTLDSVLAQTFPRERMEIIAVDGMSEDDTCSILHRYQAEQPDIQVLRNPLQSAAAGLNLGIAASTAEVVMRVDGRAILAPDYLERCLELLVATGAGNVGGLQRAKGEGLVGGAVSLAMRSRFGIGNGRFHYLERQEYVDTVYLGAFPREVLNTVGSYDEELIHNQDDELNYRIRRAGYGILLSPDIISTYTPRASFPELWTQFFNYGYWKVRVIEKHPTSVQPRHMVPEAFILGVIGSLSGYFASRRLRFLLPLALYGCLDMGATASRARHNRRLAPTLSLVFPTLHLSYGVGFLIALGQVLRSAFRSKGKQPRQPEPLAEPEEPTLSQSA